MVNIYEFARNNPSLVKQFTCKDILFLIIECPPEFTKGNELTEHNCFLYCISGKHILYSNNRSWLFQQGETVFVKKGAMGVRKIGDEVFCVLMFFVPDRYLKTFITEKIEIFKNLDTGPVTKDLLFCIETNEILRSFYDSVLAYLSELKQPDEDLIDLKFKELLLNITTDPSNKELMGYLYKLYLSHSDELQDVMDRNYMYDLSLENFARLCHRSIASFKRDFQKIYGMPPGKWLLQKRLENARHLLLDLSKTVNDAALESGFKNNTHFSRAFKINFGSSPLQFRKNQVRSPVPEL
ncbi:MAG: helix-turn-helix transcriptional regulator [Chitinophagaceae bacterium]|nr:helix-turn-helix transcriptional regulator [Chitinophagaceae bacterium]